MSGIADGHRARRRFGQNFLHDGAVIDRIVGALAPQASDHVLEIGPGRGALTLRLAGRCRLTVIEIDRDLVAALRAESRLAGVEIIEQDALKVSLAALAGDRPLRLIGNLPYNVSSPVLFKALAEREVLRDMHFMLQKEVVDRMAAAPGSKTYGRLSVMVQYACRVEPLFRVAPGAFHPVPRVDSAVVRLVPRPFELPAGDEQRLAELVRRAFGQRRKTLANALKGMLDRTAIAAAGVDPGARAETLDVAAFVRLSNRVTEPIGG